MERLCEYYGSGDGGDALPPPDGLDRHAVHRALDRERLSEIAPDIPADRLARIVRLRDEIRRDVFATPERLEVAIRRAVRAARSPRRRS
jgi:hypothetical protein